MVVGFHDFINEEGVKKTTAIGVLLLLIFSLSKIANLILLTFMLSFVFYKIQHTVYKFVNRVVRVKRQAITLFIYAGLILFAFFIAKHYLPIMIKQVSDIIRQIYEFKLANYKDEIDGRVYNLLSRVDLESYLKGAGDNVLHTLTDIGRVGIDVFLSLVLSFFFISEKDEIASIGRKMETSKISFLYTYYKQFFKSFLNSFTKVMETQILIAFINSILSMIILKFLGFHQIWGLGFMIFSLGLIPVAGVMISLVPLSIIAFKFGGVIKIGYVLGMVVFLHILESYVLNPKLMSVRTKLPVFFTFSILIVSEQLMGVWGLLLGIPIFIFILDLLEIRI